MSNLISQELNKIVMDNTQLLQNLGLDRSTANVNCRCQISGNVKKPIVYTTPQETIFLQEQTVAETGPITGINFNARSDDVGNAPFIFLNNETVAEVDAAMEEEILASYPEYVNEINLAIAEAAQEAKIKAESAVTAAENLVNTTNELTNITETFKNMNLDNNSTCNVVCVCLIILLVWYFFFYKG